MGFWRQFDIFDPLKGKPPYRPFSEMAGIVSRARWLLRGRTRDQITRLASDADFSIEQYFEMARDDEIARLEREGDTHFCDVVGCDEDAKYVFDRDKLDELEVPTPDDTSEIEALKESIGGWVDLSKDEVPDAQEAYIETSGDLSPICYLSNKYAGESPATPGAALTQIGALLGQAPLLSG